MRWLLTGLPLALLGCVYIWLTTKDVGGHAGLIALALLYFVSSLCAFSPNRSVRKVAVVAWCPLLLAVPVGTIFGVIAIKLLLDDSQVRRKAMARVKTLALSDVAHLVREEAKLVMDISDDNLDTSIERELRVSPVELTNFLDGLSIEYGLPVSGNDRGRIDTVQDIVRLVASRVPETIH